MKNSVIIPVIPLVTSVMLFFAGCEKENSLPVDGDGNHYDTVVIGTQVWLKENLKTTRYNDGVQIPLVTGNDKWASMTSGIYCWYDNNPEYKEIYGALYNWYAVNTGKLCPKGWHVPSDTEWSTLINYLGGKKVAGGKLKENGTTHWKSPNVDATNETGFTALPGGCRYFNGSFYGLTVSGYWWSASDSDTYKAWYRDIGYYYSYICRDIFPKRNGLSVRCVRD